MAAISQDSTSSSNQTDISIRFEEVTTGISNWWKHCGELERCPGSKSPGLAPKLHIIHFVSRDWHEVEGGLVGITLEGKMKAGMKL